MAEQRVSGAAARERCREPATTLDGVATAVMANIGCREDAVLAADNGADGVGLYRLEQLYLSRQALPNEDELLEIMRSAVEPVAGKPIIVRLLDVGADKKLPSLDLSAEVNPFLGRRGVRVLLAFPELLHTQLTVARASRCSWRGSLGSVSRVWTTRRGDLADDPVAPVVWIILRSRRNARLLSSS